MPLLPLARFVRLLVLLADAAAFALAAVARQHRQPRRLPRFRINLVDERRQRELPLRTRNQQGQKQQRGGKTGPHREPGSRHGHGHLQFALPQIAAQPQKAGRQQEPQRGRHIDGQQLEPECPARGVCRRNEQLPDAEQRQRRQGKINDPTPGRVRSTARQSRIARVRPRAGSPIESSDGNSPLLDLNRFHGVPTLPSAHLPPDEPGRLEQSFARGVFVIVDQRAIPGQSPGAPPDDGQQDPDNQDGIEGIDEAEHAQPHDQHQRTAEHVGMITAFLDRNPRHKHRTDHEPAQDPPHAQIEVAAVAQFQQKKNQAPDQHHDQRRADGDDDIIGQRFFTS